MARRSTRYKKCKFALEPRDPATCQLRDPLKPKSISQPHPGGSLATHWATKHREITPIFYAQRQEYRTERRNEESGARERDPEPAAAWRPAPWTCSPASSAPPSLPSSSLPLTLARTHTRTRRKPPWAVAPSLPQTDGGTGSNTLPFQTITDVHRSSLLVFLLQTRHGHANSRPMKAQPVLTSHEW